MVFRGVNRAKLSFSWIYFRLRNKYEQRKYKPKDRNQAQRHNITEEEALRNARELIEEEEQEKQREETKKAKRKVLIY